MSLLSRLRSIVDPALRARLAAKKKGRLEKTKLREEKRQRRREKESGPWNHTSQYDLAIRSPDGMQLSLPNLANRSYIRKFATRHERIFYHELARATNATTLEERVKLGSAYVRAHEHEIADSSFEIDRSSGFETMSLPDSPWIRDGRAEARRFIKRCPVDAKLPTKNAMGFIVSSEAKLNYGSNYIGYNSAICKLSMDPNIIVPVTRYLGALPILFSATVNESRNDRMFENSSQYWHIDPEDITQVKVLIYLNDVDSDTGPFTALSAGLTQTVFDALPEYGVGRLPDERVVEIVGPDREHRFTETEGTAVFCDSAKCLHYGSRPGTRRRYILFLMYSLPTSTWFPLIPGDGQPFLYTDRFQDPAATGVERAILGMELLPGLETQKKSR